MKDLSLDSKLKHKEDWNELAIALRGSWQEKKGELKKLRFLTNNTLTTFDLEKKGVGKKKGGATT